MAKSIENSRNSRQTTKVMAKRVGGDVTCHVSSYPNVLKMSWLYNMKSKNEKPREVNVTTCAEISFSWLLPIYRFQKDF